MTIGKTHPTLEGANFEPDIELKIDGNLLENFIIALCSHTDFRVDYPH